MCALNRAALLAPEAAAGALKLCRCVYKEVSVGYVTMEQSQAECGNASILARHVLPTLPHLFKLLPLPVNLTHTCRQLQRLLLRRPLPLPPTRQPLAPLVVAQVLRAIVPCPCFAGCVQVGGGCMVQKADLFW